MAGERTAYERSVLSEIRMLLDFVAGNGAINLAELKVRDFDNPGKELGAEQILVRLDVIEQSLRHSQARPLERTDFALLQLVRDAVSRMARPASGLTVAFTALVVGTRRGRQSESRATLAEEAYPALVHDARKLRFSQSVITVLAVLFTVAAIWVATQVALGKAVLNNLDGLRAQQTGITAEKMRLEQALDKQASEAAPGIVPKSRNAGSQRVAMKAFSLCDRPEAIADYIEHMAPAVRIPVHAGAPGNKPGMPPPDKLKLYTSPEERDVCERDGLLATNIGIVHAELQTYRENWPAMIGGMFTLPSHISGLASDFSGLVRNAFAQAKPPGPATGAGQSGTTDTPSAGTENQDIEFLIAPLLLVWGNYVLPIIFGFLGALMFVILDLYGKLKESRLDPRDNALSWLRLVLGLVTGACIGLFMSSYGPAAGVTGGNVAQASGIASGLVSSLTLSASGLAFLAGFSVEGVFRMLQAIVGRVFISEPAQPSRP